MTGKVIDSSAGGCFILILPIAFLIIFLFSTWPVLLALLMLGVSWNLWRHHRWQQWSQQVNPIFHKLIQENRGSVAALDLAMKANFSAATAKRYLDIKAEEFGAQRRDDENCGTVYYFVTASTLGSIFDDSEPLNQPKPYDEGEGMKDEIDSPLLSDQNQLQLPESIHPILPEAQGPTPYIPHPSLAAPKHVEPLNHKQSATKSLIQSELAKRLDVHSSTVYKRREDPDFPEWSRSRDPEDIAWQYSPNTKLFFPMKTDL